ncbi:DEAD/DEAH box helicase family protein [Streptococcus sp. E17BB]|uniref:DEAD/DEAH box helicase family protein n=1 Tax=Streptococcus sp. E17BB TaxID=3278714 RepID=UPI00359E3D49
MEQLQERLKRNEPNDLPLRKNILIHQAQHIDLKWADVLASFANANRIAPFIGTLDEGKFAEFIKTQEQITAQDLPSYVSLFGQNGLQKMNTLNEFEKSMVINLAKYYLGVHYQLLDEQGSYRGIKIDHFLGPIEGRNFINITKVAANLSNRIRLDFQAYLEQERQLGEATAQQDEPVSPILEHYATSEQGVEFYKGEAGFEAYFKGQRVAFLATGQSGKSISYENSYQQLPFLVKYDIIQAVSTYVSEQERQVRLAEQLAEIDKSVDRINDELDKLREEFPVGSRYLLEKGGFAPIVSHYRTGEIGYDRETEQFQLPISRVRGAITDSTVEVFDSAEALRHKLRLDNLSPHMFTAVLEAAYHVGQPRYLGTTPPESSELAWSRFYDWFDQFGSLEAVITQADEYGYLDKTSEFYAEYLADKAYERKKLDEQNEQKQELVTAVEEDPFYDLKSVTFEFSEAGGEAGKVFMNFQDLQNYLTGLFERDKKAVDSFIEQYLETGEKRHWYDKTWLNFNFENKQGEEYVIRTRVDMGFAQGDFNPYLQKIEHYEFPGMVFQTEDGRSMSMSEFGDSRLSEHDFSPDIIALLKEAIGDNQLETHFANLQSAYDYASQFARFIERFPIIESYVGYVTSPYPLLEQEKLIDVARKELSTGQYVTDSVTLSEPDDLRGGVILPSSPAETATEFIEKILDDRIVTMTAFDSYYLWHWESLQEMGASQEMIDEFHKTLPDFSFKLEGLSIEDSDNSGASGYLALNGASIDEDSINQWLDEQADGTMSGRLEKLEQLEAVLNSQWPVIVEAYDKHLEAVVARYELRENFSEVVEQFPLPKIITPSVQRQDFSFPEDLTDFYPKGTRAKVEANLAAIRLLKELEDERRQANPAEQEVLAKYVGWGGLANSFFNPYDTKFASERAELKNLISPSEYDAMKESSLTAYYTDPAIIREMYQKLVADGFKGGRILDPSMGTGNFFAAMPKEIRENCEFYGVELDPITGAIAQQLQPSAKIQVKGFEETQFTSGSFDLIISNIPFANVRVADTRYDKPYVIHDYFVKKSMDLLRDGGQLSIISSTGTMDKRTGNVLRDIEPTTQFLGGVRLPDTAFRKIAGTSVTTDILYFQKDERKQVRPISQFNALAFGGSMQLPNDNRVWINPFFGRVDPADNSFVLGEFEVKNFNGGTLAVRQTSDDFLEDLKTALNQTLPAFDIFAPLATLEQPIAVKQEIPQGLSEDMRLYSFAYVGDTVYYRGNTSIRVGTRVEDISYYVDEEGTFQDWADNPSKRLVEQYQQLGITDETALDIYQSDEPAQRGKNKGYYKKTVFFETPLTDKEVSRIKGMVDLRDTYQALIDLQRHSNYDQFDFEQILTKLNKAYDDFVKKHGYLNSTVNRNLFDSDDRYSLLASLEDEYIDDMSKKVAYKKSLAFERPLIRPERIFNEVTTAKDALNISVAEGRGVDFDFMMSLYKGKTELDLIDELGEEIIPNPNLINQKPLAYLPKNAFLSGDVVTRLEEVEAKILEGDTSHNWSRYKEMLEEIRPERIGLTDIDYKIGSRWIPDRIYAYFAQQTFVNRPIENFSDTRLDHVLKTNPIDHKMEYVSGGLSYSSSQDIQLGVADSRHNRGRHIFLNLLNANQAIITKKVVEEGKEKQVMDVEKTAELRAKEAELQDLFRAFVDKSPEIQQVMEDAYNNLYNRTVTREYDGSHLVIDGLAQNISLRPHQKNAIQRIVEERRALLAHEVGSGKTLTMLGAGFKMKELGMVNKPLYVVPSSLTAQFGQEIMKFFPTKNVFVTTKKDFIKSNRKQFISRIITGDYDAIVIGDSQFEKIPMSKELQQAYICDKLSELREIKERSKEQGGDGHTVKQIETSIKGFKEQLQKLQEIDQDSFIEFENLGIDCLFVDEAHHFKNIRPVTNLGNVAGITNKTSKKNIDMEMKVRQIQSEHDNTGIIFATGTPVSNSISEMYTMMNYVQPDVLERYQVDNFDAWVGAFGQIENSMELSPTGDKYQPKKRFKKFTNLPELMKIYKETTDIQTSDMLNLPVPEARIIPVESELTESQRDYLANLVERSDAVKSGQVEPTEDNMLRITSEARKLAIDMRLLDDSYDLSDNNKLLQVVDNVERIYYEGDESKVTQMIFSDIGTPKSKTNLGNFDVYNELRNLLIERGIPAQEIAFVHDANTDEKKNTLSRKVNAGEVRVLLASTEKGGTGLNVQRKMKAVHHLDVPWRPSDLTQRNGRLIRQGNENKEVDIYHYITKGSFDNFLWETQEKKLKYITQIMTSKDPVRSAEDIDEQTMTASDFKALATGNPYLRQKMELENQLNLLENQKRAFNRNQDNARETLKQVDDKLPALERKLSGFEVDKVKAENSKGADFTITLDGQTFDKKKEAGQALHELLLNNQSDTKELRTLGIYRGFELRALTNDNKSALFDFSETLLKPTYILQVVGANQYPVTLDLESAVTSIRRIDSTIDGIVKEEEKAHKIIANYQTHAAAARETLEKTFPMEDYQRVKEKYDLLAPLIEQGKPVEVIEEAIQNYVDRQQPKDVSHQISLEL